MDFLVIKFYDYFLKTDAGFLFQHTEMDHQYKMFASSLNVIITHIVSPHLLTDNLDKLIESHTHYGVSAKHIDLFIDCFMKALQEVFESDRDKLILNLWKKLLTTIMYYFRDNV